MLKYTFAFIILVHGLIHLLGVGRSFGYGNITQLTKEISKPIGMLWLLTALLFIVVVILFIMKKDYWCIVGIVAVLLSQALIFTVWKDAKAGCIVNIIILVAIVAAWGSIQFENTFRKHVKANFETNNPLSADVITEADLKLLPEPVKKYLRFAGVLNRPKVKNMRIVFKGELREKGKKYLPFTSEQYNFCDESTRLFFMKGSMFGITFPGYHHYINGNAVMDIRLFGWFPIVKKSGDVMNKAETVTLFNDMCLMAPATLIDKRIQWQAIDSNSTKAIFTNHGISIAAVLYFNDRGELIDFISSDRSAVTDMKQYPFSTPAKNYKIINGINVMTYGEAIWHYPDGKFVYGKFNLKEIEYNLSYFKK